MKLDYQTPEPKPNGSFWRRWRWAILILLVPVVMFAIMMALIALNILQP